MFVQTLKHNLKIKPMKKNELRIGNFVYHPLTSRTYQVSENDLLAFAKNLVTNTPITLTKEWLFKFGFEVEDDYLELQINEHLSIIYVGYLALMIDGVIIQVNNTNSDKVHQLQNLYFALTGEELKQQEQ
jgi:hypothetical protein